MQTKLAIVLSPGKLTAIEDTAYTTHGEFGEEYSKIDRPVDDRTFVNVASPSINLYKDYLNKLNYNDDTFSMMVADMATIENSSDPDLLIRIGQLEQLEHDIEAQLDYMTTYSHNNNINVSLIEVESNNFLSKYLIDTAVVKALENSYKFAKGPAKSKIIDNTQPVLQVRKVFENFGLSGS